MSILKTLNKKYYLGWGSYAYICLCLFIIYFAIASHTFLYRNPLVNLKHRYSFVFIYPKEILTFKTMDEFQYSKENFMDILKREGITK